jgi:hypothetical protein
LQRQGLLGLIENLTPPHDDPVIMQIIVGFMGCSWTGFIMMICLPVFMFPSPMPRFDPLVGVLFLINIEMGR